MLAADADGEATVHPLFRCNASLSIPVTSIAPSPDEVQVAVGQAVKLILGSLKSVTQWSVSFNDAGEGDQRPTTSGTITGSAKHRDATLHDDPE